MNVLTPCPPGVWSDDLVVVERIPRSPAHPQNRPGTLAITAGARRLHVRHSLTHDELGDQLVPAVTAAVGAAGLGQRAFESILVGLVRSTVDDPLESWTTYYRNSLLGLLGGTADFAPVHARARTLVTGSVLDLGSCFGFFPLELALTGTEVTATDIDSGTMALLATVAPQLGAQVRTLVCDAAQVPVPNNSADTVTALHLLEHVDADSGLAIIAEALRIARHRVVVAVPFEQVATACHGHVRTFDSATLHALGQAAGVRYEVGEDHGGWLVLHL